MRIYTEKYQATVKLGLANSRMKDYYDLWLLSRQFAFEGGKLRGAIKQTFEHRNTALDDQPVGFRKAFVEDPTKLAQWAGFVHRAQLEDAPTLQEAVSAASGLLIPPTLALISTLPFDLVWSPPGPWRARPGAGI